MNIQRVKQGAKITLYNGIYMILFGLFYVVFINFNMRSNFHGIGVIWQLFTKYNPEVYHLFMYLNIIIGVFMISMGIIVIYMSYFILKRKEKMTWVVLLLSGLIGWAGLLIVSFFIGNKFLVGLSFFGWFSFIIGMILPLRYYVEKQYREY
jgi:uncharacterized membrane protein HdeD (DUF308 family)